MSTYPAQVVCVDDDDDIREICVLALQAIDPGVSVHACSSGAQALQLVAEVRPDVVLLDVMMPGLDGPATLKRLQQHDTTADIPVIFVTAKATADERRRLISLGALDVIFKPFDPRTLLSRVRSSLQQAVLPVSTTD